MKKFNTGYGKKPKVIVECKECDDRALQSHKDECDINKIIARYDKTGILTHATSVEPIYGDAPAIDFHTAMNVVAQGESSFEKLPSAVRKEFDNDAGKFMTFIQDEKNFDKMVEMGLAKKREEKKDERIPASTKSVDKKMDTGKAAGEAKTEE